MKDDIKEINIKFPGQILDYVDTKEHLLELFNYITNLQEEKDKYKNVIDEIKDDLKKTIQYNVKSHDIFGNRYINVDLDHINYLLELLEEVDE